MIFKRTSNEKQQHVALCYTCIVFLKETLQGLVALPDRAELNPGP